MFAKRKEKSAVLGKADDSLKCEHKGSFKAFGTDSIGFVTCLNCGRAVGMDDAFNVMAQRMEAMADRALAAALLYEERVAKL
jgi:ribosomal protein S26